MKLKIVYAIQIFKKKFLKKYLPYAPLWTNLMGAMVETTENTRISNSPIESYFNINKNINLNVKRHVRTAFYARKTKKFIQAKLKEIKNHYGIFESKNIRKRNAETLVEDMWKSTPKRIRKNINNNQMIVEKDLKK